MNSDSHKNGQPVSARSDAHDVHIRIGRYRRHFRWRTRETILFVLCSFLAVVVMVLAILVTIQAINKNEMSERLSVYTLQSEQQRSQKYIDKYHPAFNETLLHWHRDGICLTQGCVRAASRMISSMDSSIDPCSDFYQFACGSWSKVNVMPDDRANYNTFSKLSDSVHAIIKDLLAKPVLTHDCEAIGKAKDLYVSCMNETQIGIIGLQPIHRLLSEFGGWPVVCGPSWPESDINIVDLLVKLRQYNNKVFIDQWVNADDKNSDVNIIQLDQADLGMPSPAYYLSVDNLDVYKRYAIKVAIMFGADSNAATAEMDDVVGLEIKLANFTTPGEARRDNEKLYNRMTIKQLHERVPGFNWLEYLQKLFLPANIDIKETEEIVVYAPEYLEKVVPLFSETNKRTLVNYIIWRIMMNRVDNLPRPYRDVRMEYNKKIFGSEVEEFRWKTCVKVINDHMGQAVGRLFVEENFDETSKSTALEMILNIREAFYELLEEVEWMDVRTRVVAREKADAIREKIGYAEAILNNTVLDEEYRGINFTRTDYIDNILSYIQHLAVLMLSDLRKPVDRTKWSTSPAVVNAFYNSAKNQILFPAAILQPPFYSKENPKSLNYGGIGMVIGHEITHGFDDKGRQFDKGGNLIQWWDDHVIRRFEQRAQCIIDQYSNYTVTDVNMPLNGIKTQGENIADNGGIKQAFRAYRKWVERAKQEEPLLPGLTQFNNDQLFFINFAQIWCGKLKPEAVINQLHISSHSPSRYRVIGTLQNFELFSDAFMCPENSYMNPKNKCLVW